MRHPVIHEPWMLPGCDEMAKVLQPFLTYLRRHCAFAPIRRRDRLPVAGSALPFYSISDSVPLASEGSESCTRIGCFGQPL